MMHGPGGSGDTSTREWDIDRRKSSWRSFRFLHVMERQGPAPQTVGRCERIWSSTGGARVCWLRSSLLCCLSCASSTDQHRGICGKIEKATIISSPRPWGGEQGDPLMPLLFAQGQHRALVAVHSRLLLGESLMAYLDDNYVVSGPDRVEDVHTALEEELFRHCHIRVHACDVLECLAACHDSGPVWRGSDVHTYQQGVKILGTPLGYADFVQAELESVAMDHQVLLRQIPGVPDVQAAWLLLLHCAQGPTTC